METGIKESLEVLEGVKVLAVAGKKIAKDGKVNKDDLPTLLELAKNHQALIDAVQDIGDVKAEAKDYSSEELMALGAKALEIVKAYKEA